MTIGRSACRPITHAAYEVVVAGGASLALLKSVERVQPDVIVIDTESPSRDTLEHLAASGSRSTRARPRESSTTSTRTRTPALSPTLVLCNMRAESAAKRAAARSPRAAAVKTMTNA